MPFSSKSALVVEADPCFRAVAELMLRRINFKTVTVAEDGEQAWDHLNFVRFDFILSGWNMEPLDGLQLLRRVRGNPQLSRICFVLMSTDLSPKSRQEATDAGASDFLLKPFTWQQLHETVRTAFSTRVADQANVMKFPIRTGVRRSNAHAGARLL